MLIDTHAHLNFKAFKNDLEKVINNAKKVGVAKIIIPGAKIDSSEEAVRIAKKYQNCFAAVGIHPHHANSLQVKSLKSLKYNSVSHILNKLLKKRKVISIGEIGLDYHQYKGYPPISNDDKKKQEELFIFQLNLARRYNLPVILHCREAFADLLNILKQFKLQDPKKLGGVFHCFSGTKDDLINALSLGFYIGFDCNIACPQNFFLRELIKSVPFERLLLETDSPFLAPVFSRDRRNTPANLLFLAEEIAKIRHISKEEIAKITSYNAIKLFRL